MAARQHHVLVVDDLPDNRGVLAQQLAREGYRVSQAANGLEALETIRLDPPDLVLLDLMMPVMDGFTFLDRLKAERTDFLPVIVISAVQEREARLRALKMGAHEFLLKPVDRDEVAVRVRTLIDLKLAREAAQGRAEELELLVTERTGKLMEAHQRLEEAHQQLAKAHHELQERAQSLAHAYEELRRTDLYKDEFLSVISHELRTPLNFIMGFGSLLQDEIGGPLSFQQLEFVSKMLEGADRMLGLVNDLLDIAKIQAGKLSVCPSSSDYSVLVADTLASLRPLADRKRLYLEANIQSPLMLVLDVQRICQVLTNLVSNAIKFTPDGGRITVKAFQHRDEVITQVIDTGRGIPSEEIPHLFTRFRQLDMSSTREQGGTGLGLAISKAIVEAHEGAIGVLSAPGEGATFWFSLPLEPALHQPG